MKCTNCGWTWPQGDMNTCNEWLTCAACNTSIKNPNYIQVSQTTQKSDFDGLRNKLDRLPKETVREIEKQGKTFRSKKRKLVERIIITLIATIIVQYFIRSGVHLVIWEWLRYWFPFLN